MGRSLNIILWDALGSPISNLFFSFFQYLKSTETQLEQAVSALTAGAAAPALAAEARRLHGQRLVRALDGATSAWIFLCYFLNFCNNFLSSLERCLLFAAFLAIQQQQHQPLQQRKMGAQVVDQSKKKKTDEESTIGGGSDSGQQQLIDQIPVSLPVVSERVSPKFMARLRLSLDLS